MRWVRRLARIGTKTVIAVVIVGLLVPVGGAGTILAAFIFLPLPATLPDPDPGLESQISHIFDADGQEIGIFRVFEQIVPINPDDIPQVLKHAVVSAEDRSFYDHGGVDVRGTLRALVTDLRGGEAEQGGSTITQQYVRNAYAEVGKEKSLARKVREAILASQLDRQVDKEEILFRYLDSVYFGEGAYGVGAAAETYFRKHVSELTLSEAATLAGLIPAPSRYEPRSNPDAAELKRTIVLDAMLEEGYIDAATHAAARQQKVHLAASGAPEGEATVVYPPTRQDTKYPYFVDYVRRYLEEKYGRDKVFRGGLSVYTTLDPTMQEAAESSVAATLDGTEPPLEMALVSIEPPTGFVRALVGGRDFNAEQTNLALGVAGAGSGRQPGSSFKPLVLATAFEKAGLTPDKRYSGRSGICIGPTDVPEPYCPKNYGGASYGTLDLRTATAKSVNTVFAQLIWDVGVEKTMDLAKEMGITTARYDPAVHGASIALGSLDVNVVDMASAYSTFASRGVRQDPTPVLRVLDSDGRVLEDNAKREGSRILREEVADNVTDVLRGVLGPGGTAGRWGIGRPAAGKTGTTDDSADAWFVGFTPVLSTAVWMGYSDTRRSMRGIKGISAVTGGSLPAQTWNAYMKQALANIPATEFNEPAPLRPVADQVSLELRRGFDLGNRRYAADAPIGGPFAPTYEPPPASPPPPPTTTTTVPPTTTTTEGGISIFPPPADDPDGDPDDD
ncbi:MAG TPA: transglycosylase domain-containing protein [Acidimicrobiales bacterium]